MLIVCPQSLQVMRVPLAMFLVVVYMAQAYALLVTSAEAFNTVTAEFDRSGYRFWSVENLFALWEAYEQRRAERAA
jgi:hypothetical protein